MKKTPSAERPAAKVRPELHSQLTQAAEHVRLAASYITYAVAPHARREIAHAKLCLDTAEGIMSGRTQ